jgi:hypothetical protein
VKAEAGILESDPLEVADRKLQAVAPVGADQAWMHQRLRPLVGMGAPEASRQENFTAWRRFLESLAEEQPSVFVFEDLHWADPALLEFIEHVAEFAEAVPMLVVATTSLSFTSAYRPSRRPPGTRRESTFRRSARPTPRGLPRICWSNRSCPPRCRRR